MRSLKTCLHYINHTCTRALFFPIVFAWALLGCDGTTSPTADTETSQGVLNLAVPEKIRTVSAINLDAVQAIATVNNEDIVLSRSGDGFQATLTIDVNSQVTISLRFLETLPDGTVITLAEHPAVTRNITDSDQRLEFFSNNYETDAFDFDGDGVSNIDERELETDPLVPSNIPSDRIIDVSFNLPGIILEPQITQAITSFSGGPRAVRRDGNFFQITGTAPTSSEVVIEVILRQLQQLEGNNQTIVIANATRTVPLGIDDEIIQLTDSDFNFNIDSDGDGRNNLQELQQGTNPLVND